MLRKAPNLLNPLKNKAFQQISIEKLKLYEKNARKHSKAQIDKLKESMSAFGFVCPIITDKANRVLAGHARLQAAKELGYETVPIIRVEHLTEKQMQAFIIADNRLAELAEWDEDVLKFELNELVTAEINFEIDFSSAITGFETAQIDKLLLNTKNSNELEEAEGSLATISEKPLVSRLGDLWLLGKHKIYCGDAIQRSSYQKLMNGEKARILCADPPYNVKIDGHATGNGIKRHAEFRQASGEMSSEQFTQFLYQNLLVSCTCLEDGALAYLFMDWRHDRELQDAARKAKLNQINLAVWDKQTGSMGSLYRSQHELIFIYKNGTKSHTNNIMLGKYGRNRGNVWYHPGANRSGEGKKALKNHPTPKPIPLIMDIILDASKPGDIILDPFLGSGTSILAATKTNRFCYGIEIEPKYVDLTIRRWEELTGEQAVHAETGKTFSEHEKDQYRVHERSVKKGGGHVRER